MNGLGMSLLVSPSMNVGGVSGTAKGTRLMDTARQHKFELTAQEKRMNRKARIKAYYKAQHGECAYCGQRMTLKLDMPNSATIDHIIPRSKGGRSNKFNEIAACATCNRIKGDQPLYTVVRTLKLVRG